ncbi:MAG: energy-coupling factor transporter transmembrane protein EcfT [Ruminococcaceae bacterium]|nr:energy-coupling factor transporter transmembrane protein EcfT [Oscillospiraceae bacterium]
MKNIALGQYYPAKSPIHRLDPRIKVILAILYIVCATFLGKNMISFGLLLLSAFLLILLGRIPMKTVLRGIMPVLFVMAFAALFQIFGKSGEILLFEWKFIHIYLEGILAAVFMVVRIFALIVGTTIFLTYTTTPIELTDAIEDLLSPLKKLKVPVHDFAMMMTLALRFIPTLVEETDKIMTAQKARGADFTTGSIIERAKALIPVLIPLIVSAIRHAVELAVAMECRCYHGDGVRTRMTVRHLRVTDFVVLLLMIGFGASLVWFNILGIGFSL